MKLVGKTPAQITNGDVNTFVGLPAGITQIKGLTLTGLRLYIDLQGCLPKKPQKHEKGDTVSTAFYRCLSKLVNARCETNWSKQRLTEGIKNLRAFKLIKLVGGNSLREATAIEFNYEVIPKVEIYTKRQKKNSVDSNADNRPVEMTNNETAESSTSPKDLADFQAQKSSEDRELVLDEETHENRIERLRNVALQVHREEAGYRVWQAKQATQIGGDQDEDETTSDVYQDTSISQKERQSKYEPLNWDILLNPNSTNEEDYETEKDWFEEKLVATEANENDEDIF